MSQVPPPISTIVQPSFFHRTQYRHRRGQGRKRNAFDFEACALCALNCILNDRLAAGDDKDAAL